MKKLLIWTFPFLMALCNLLGQHSAYVLNRESSPANEARPYLPKSHTKESLEHLLKPYSAPQEPHAYMREHEIAQRLTYLQDLAEQNNKSDVLLQIYKDILENRKEEWIVQRQVLRNLQPYWGDINERQRDKLLSQVDLRARATFHLADKDFIQLFEKIP